MTESICVGDYLQQFADKTIYYKANPGNGGDALIAFATLRLFERLGLNYRLVEDHMDLSGKLVIYGGGGNLVGYYHTAAQFIARWHQQVAQLIILPHTIAEHSQLLEALSSNVTIFCREQMSYRYVKQFANIGQVYLAEDMALTLKPEDYAGQLKPYAQIARAANYQHVFSSIWKGKRSFSFFFSRRDNQPLLNAFREDVEASLHPLPDNNVDLTALINLDKSMQNQAKIEETALRVLGFINFYPKVRTNRLHVGIGAALLGKQVEFYDNAYHKNKEVYQQSLQQRFPNVTWMGDNQP